MLTKLQSLRACRSIYFPSDVQALPLKYQLEQDGLHLNLSSLCGKASEWKPEVLVQPGCSDPKMHSVGSTVVAGE